MRNLLATLLVCLAASGCGMLVLAKAERDAAGGSSAANASQDVQFLRDIAHIHHAEIAAGNLAAQKAASAQVRKYGRQMADEHLKAQAQAAAKDLKQFSGEDFDRAYVQLAARDQRDTIRLLERTAGQAQGKDLRAFAESALPHVRKHLEAAAQLAKR